MVENIIVGVLCLIAVGAAVWGFWFERENNESKTKDTLKNKKEEA
jgi:hypothetical protein